MSRPFINNLNGKGWFKLLEYIFIFLFISEEISRLNWSAGGQIVDGYILSQIDDENVSNFLPEINSEFIFPYGDEAEYCNSSSFPNSALNISDKGKSKMV